MAVQDQKPLVLVLGQHAWADTGGTDTVLDIALNRLHKDPDEFAGWNSLLEGSELTSNTFDWLAERFERRVHPTSLEILADIPWSAIFTSSIDPTLTRLFSREGREPEPVVTNDEFPRAVRSRARPPLYYLFSRADIIDPIARPPSNAFELNTRRSQHTSQLLNRLLRTTTAVGHIVVEGFQPERDWLMIDDVLGAIANASVGQVLWCGGIPKLTGASLTFFNSIVSQGQIIVEDSSLSSIISELRALGRLPDLLPPESEDVGVISFGPRNRLETTPELRLTTEAVASIVDDSWTPTFLSPLGPESEYSVFRRFHGHLEGPRLLVEGVQRGFAIERNFENRLLRTVKRAVNNHASIKGPIIVSGQSGTGKSVALARVVANIRGGKNAAVLYSIGHIPQAEEVSPFCEAAEEAGAKSTLIVCDANRDVDSYYDLLVGLRSRGRRAVVLGSYYLPPESDDPKKSIAGIDAPVNLTKDEKDKLAALLAHYLEASAPSLLKEENILGLLYRFLPPSRPRISVGLSNEAYANEQALRKIGRQSVPATPATAMQQALMRAGILESHHALFDQEQESLIVGNEDAASKIIDFVMVAGTLACPVPFNLLLRAANQQYRDVDLTLLGDLFDKVGLFKWQHVDREGNELLVAPRLRLEAQLICRRRLGSTEAEADRLLQLIGAVRSGIERDEELNFLLRLLQQINPDGQRSGQYKNFFAAFAKELTRIRDMHRVVDARLMLQESAYRRAAIRTNAVDDNDRLPLLEEARNIVQKALDQIDNGELDSTKKTRQNLLVERAALYGFLSTDRARRKAESAEIWSSYEAARAAVKRAAGATESYYPLDVGLWTPADLLEIANLSPWHRGELVADIYAILDQVEMEILKPSQRDKFDSRRMIIGMTLGNEKMTEEAFTELEARGSTAGYYLRAREYAPTLEPDTIEVSGEEDLSRARRAADFLSKHFQRIENDSRCLFLLLECRWISEMGRRPLRGERQPLPSEEGVIRELLDIVRALNNASGESSRYSTRYLEAVLSWLIGEYEQSRRMFRELSNDTDFENPSRVIRRHLITASGSIPRQFEGRVERSRGKNDWVIRVEGLSQLVPILERDFPNDSLAYGRPVRGFRIGFNFIGPIADPLR